ncbi:MAG TPA: DUF29 domain-containing protein [Stellaceae bacterium]|nr:DUF29 domain-containing protein [Stellaceae bacterium]
MGEAKSRYDEDFLLWSKEQAEALRAAAKGGSNRALDWEHIAEEIEDLGRSQRSALASQIMRIVQHLVKLSHSPSVEPRNGWRRTIRLARLQAQRRLEENPSLRPELGRIIEEETRRGIEYAIADLEEHDEIDAVDANAVRRTRYTEEQVLGDWFPEE